MTDASDSGIGKSSKRPRYSDSDSEQSNTPKKVGKSPKKSPTVLMIDSLVKAVDQMGIVCNLFLIETGSDADKNRLIRALEHGISDLQSANRQAQETLNKLKTNENVEMTEEYSKYSTSVVYTNDPTLELQKCIENFTVAFCSIVSVTNQICFGTPPRKVPKLFAMQRVCISQTKRLEEIRPAVNWLPILAAAFSTIFAIRAKVMTRLKSTFLPIRNAALQLFGAIVPKLVGQTQYFINPDISWEPVNTAYNDIIAKMIGIHKHILHIIDGHKFMDKSSILLVSVLELLSRVEVIGQLEDIHELRKRFFMLIRFDSEKIRNLAAKSLARFHEFYEIRQIVDHLLPQLFRTASENTKHGIVISIFYLLQKYESDVRFTGNASDSFDLFGHTRALALSNCLEQNSSTSNTTSYYVRCYLLNLLLFIRFDIFDEIVLKIIFDCGSNLMLKVI